MPRKEFTLLAFAQNKLRPEDKCAIIKLAASCEDMLVTVSQIYREVGR